MTFCCQNCHVLGMKNTESGPTVCLNLWSPFCINGAQNMPILAAKSHLKDIGSLESHLISQPVYSKTLNENDKTFWGSAGIMRLWGNSITFVAMTFSLDSALCLRVCDYGLTRELYEKYYYDSDDTKIPYKWLAPECLTEGRYTSKSDVVSQISYITKWALI